MTKWIAHRGVSAVAPENTMAAFTLAWAHDVDGIECDVQVSKDGVVLVHHDERTARCGSEDYVIADSDYERLLSVDIGSFKAPNYANERISTLTEVLDAMPTGKIIQVEIKPDVIKIDPIIEILASARKDIELIVISFNADILSQITKVCTNLQSLWILDEEEAKQPNIFTRAKAYGFSGVDVNYRVIDQSYITAAHEHHLLVGAWTVNTLSMAKQLTAWGLDMLASDYTPTLLERG